MTEVTIVIPNWNEKKLLEECLSSIFAQKYKNFEVILVDNGSTDGSVMILNNFPLVKLIRLEKNYGFAKAVNVGIINSKSKYVLLLNNDTIVEDNFLSHMVRAIKSEKNISGVAPKVLSYKNPKIIDSAGDKINTLGQAFNRGRGNFKEKWDTKESVFLITAGASIFKKSSFKKIGYFEESFFAYGEDVDWCFRAQLQGLRFLYEPKAIVYHHHKATSKKTPKKTEYLQFRNMTLFILRNFPSQLLLKKGRFIFIILVHLNTFLYMVKKGLWKEAILADLWITFHLLTILVDRASIQRKRKVNISYIESQLEDKEIRFWGILDK